MIFITENEFEQNASVYAMNNTAFKWLTNLKHTTLVIE